MVDKIFYPKDAGLSKEDIVLICRNQLGKLCFDLEQLTDEDAQEFVDEWHDIDMLLKNEAAADNGGLSYIELIERVNNKIQTRFAKW